MNYSTFLRGLSATRPSRAAAVTHHRFVPFLPPPFVSVSAKKHAVWPACVRFYLC